jgi:hypothetical protein
VEQNTSQNKQKLKHRMPKRKSKAIVFIAIGSVALMLIIVIVSVIFINNQKSKQKPVSVCGESIVDPAAKYLTDQNYDELGRLTENILKTKNYNKDSNCLFITTSYYINLQNNPKAEEQYSYLGKLKDINISPKLLVQVYQPPLEYLKKRIDFLNLLENRARGNYLKSSTTSQGSSEQ